MSNQHESINENIEESPGMHTEESKVYSFEKSNRGINENYSNYNHGGLLEKYKKKKQISPSMELELKNKSK